MPPIAQTQILYKKQREFEAALAAALLLIWVSIRDQLERNAVAGVILPRAAAGIIASAQGELSRFFVGAGVPFTAAGVPLSEYAVLLERITREVQEGVIQAHSAFIASTVDAETLTWLQAANFSPLAPPRYDPLHLWVDPRGYRLSDRIWSADIGARQKIDRYLTYNIQAGTSAKQMSAELKNLLLPNRAPLKTTRPYGTNVSFDAMRLARTEIAHAHTEMTFIAAQQNPFVTGMDWALSARHPKVDVCDRLATIGMSGERLREPYDIDESPRVVQDSHPACICNNSPSVSNVENIIETLSERRDRLDAPPVTPVNVGRFRAWAYT